MLSLEKARALAVEYANSQYAVPGDTLEIIDRDTMETSYGWVFFPNSTRYLRTRDPSDALAGNSPLLVLKQNGAVYELGTARPVLDALAELEVRNRLR